MPLLSPAPLASGTPLISVVIPAYNYGHYLIPAIQSVQRQTLSDWELLVIDDGSTDDTRERIATLTEPRLRYLHQANAGLSAARNHGLHLARGSYIALLDADDLWEPEHLALCLERLDGLGPEFGLVAGQARRIDALGQALPEAKHARRYRHAGALTARHFCLRNRVFPSAVVARRSVYQRCGGFDPALRSSEDRDMWIRACGQAGFWLLDVETVCIRRHPQNMSKNAPRMQRNTRATLLKAFRRGSVSPLDLPFWLRAFAVHYFQVAWTHFDEGRRAAAFGYLLASLALWPVFLRPDRFAEPPLFRLRALAHFLLRTAAAWRKAHPQDSPAWI